MAIRGSGWIYVGAASAFAITLGATPVEAQQAAKRAYHLPAQPLGDSLRAVAVASGTNIIAPSALVAGKAAPPLVGQFVAIDAVAALTRGSGLRARPTGQGLIIEQDGLAGYNSAAGLDAAEMVITGSRIRGAPISSPVITLSQDDIRNAGQAGLGEVVRNIPQSFGGGQNPGIGFNVPAINGVDVGGGSSINLRGLGSDATLTLLNGHRLSYSGSRQSIDVSTIPLGALDRIEIVADGASALYGSDAVGGVANIILRRDRTDFEARARLGASTDGGYFQQQYGATGGSRWASGGFIAAYEFNRTTAINAEDRSYAETRSPGLSLLPASRNHNALVSAHQVVTDGLEFAVDGLLNKRWNLLTYAQNPAGDLTVSRAQQATRTRAFAVAPSLYLSLDGGWRLAVSGSYAKDRVAYRIESFTPSAQTLLGAGCYCNGAQSIEIAGDGRLFSLPGGWAKAALGAGYRNTDLENDRGAGSPLNFRRSQANHYAYGELSLPLVGPQSRIPGVSRLNLSGAVRYERYAGIGSVATPKFGLVYSPLPLIDLKASWGRSFRAPTLLQRYQPPALTLLRAASFGGVDLPASATALYIQGGNGALKPERATSWSVTTTIHPPELPAASLELSYFETRYVDRIVTPIGFISQALNNPVYAAQITRAPSPDQLAAILASGTSFSNGTGMPYVPANVVAFIDNSNVNAGRQLIHGLDVLASYRGDLGPSGDTLTVAANVSYLVSHRQISSEQPDLPLAGILFNPPHWRAHGGMTWHHDGLSLTADATYTGSLSDTRTTPAVRIAPQATFDLAARYRTGDDAPQWLRGLDLTLSVQNLFNVAPPSITTSLVTDTPYDSTNYSPIGRFVTLTIARSW